METTELAKVLASKTRKKMVIPSGLSDRDTEIIQAYMLGAMPKVLTRHYKISKTRLYQIVSRAYVK